MIKLFRKLKIMLVSLWRLHDILEIHQRALELMDEKIGEHVTIHADVHMKSPSLIIAIGTYRDVDYVRAFEVDHRSFNELVEMLKHIEPNSRVGKFDMFPGVNISSVYPRDRF